MRSLVSGAGENLHAKGLDDWTALHLAADGGHAACIEVRASGIPQRRKVLDTENPLIRHNFSEPKSSV